MVFKIRDSSFLFLRELIGEPYQQGSKPRSPEPSFSLQRQWFSNTSQIQKLLKILLHRRQTWNQAHWSRSLGHLLAKDSSPTIASYDQDYGTDFLIRGKGLVCVSSTTTFPRGLPKGLASVFPVLELWQPWHSLATWWKLKWWLWLVNTIDPPRSSEQFEQIKIPALSLHLWRERVVSCI